MSRTFVFKRYDIQTAAHEYAADLERSESTDGDYVLAQDAIDREAVLQAQIRTLETQLKDARTSNIADTADDRMPDSMREFIEGMSVSVDVSTGDHDAGNRYFGTVTEVMDCSGDKHGVTLLVQDAEANFARSIADTAGAKLLPDELSKLIATLRDRADSDEMAASEIDPLHYTPDEPESIVAGLECLASERRECAEVLEQQAAVIAEQGRKIADYIVELEARAALSATPASSGDTAGAKPCPLCAAELPLAKGYFTHPKNDCYLSGLKLSEHSDKDVAAWNRRAAPPAPSVADTAGAKKLKPCPFCGSELDTQWNRPNPKARCRTEGCKGKQLPVLNLDQPDDIAAWNRRALLAAGASEGQADFEWPKLPGFPSPLMYSPSHGHPLFSEHQMQGYANAYGEAVRVKIADSRPAAYVLPAELTPPVRRILGMMLWETGPIAGALRAAGKQINNRAEDEQAAALHWLLGFALEHGMDWEKPAAAALLKMTQGIKD